MTFQSQLKLALVACTFVFSNAFVNDEAAGQCWRKHNTVLPQTYPIWTMWNGIDPFQRTCLPPLGPTNTCPSCAAAPTAANVWVADDATAGGVMAEAPTLPMVPLVPAQPAQNVELPDADASPSDVITAPPVPEDNEVEQEGSTDELTELKKKLDEAMQRTRAAEERAYASEKSARAAQAEAEKRVSELKKKIEDAKID